MLCAMDLGSAGDFVSCVLFFWWLGWGSLFWVGWEIWCELRG